MSSEFFRDYIAECNDQGMTFEQALNEWRSMKRKEDQAVFQKVRKMFCEKFGFDETMTDDEISVALLLRGMK